jgi:hypothetical protein
MVIPSPVALRVLIAVLVRVLVAVLLRVLVAVLFPVVVTGVLGCRTRVPFPHPGSSQLSRERQTPVPPDPSVRSWVP